MELPTEEYIDIDKITYDINIKKNNFAEGYQVQPQLNSNSITIQPIGRIISNSSMKINNFFFKPYGFECDILIMLLTDDNYDIFSKMSFYPVIKLNVYHKDQQNICSLYYGLFSNKKITLSDIHSATESNSSNIYNGRFGVILEINSKCIIVKILDTYTSQQQMITDLVKCLYEEIVVSIFDELKKII